MRSAFGSDAYPMKGGRTRPNGGGLMVFNPTSRAILYVDASALALVRMGESDLLGSDVDEIIGELIDLTPRAFPWRGPGGDDLEVELEPLRAGPFVRVGAMVLKIMRAPPGAAISTEIARFEALCRAAMRGDAQDERALLELVREGARSLDLTAGMIAYPGGDGPSVDVVVHDVDAATSDDREPPRPAVRDALLDLAPVAPTVLAIADVRRRSRVSALARCKSAFAPGVRAFVATSVVVHEVRCTLALWSPRPRRSFTSEDHRYVAFLAEALTQLLLRRRNDEHMRRLAYSDELTGLPNRAALFSRIDETLAAAERHGLRAAILFIDVDGFNAVNDSIGHAAGDLVLAELSQRVRATLRRSEFIGRLGGDEFAIVLPQVAGRDEIDRVVMGVSSEMARSVAVEGYRFTLSASIGTSPSSPATAARAMRCSRVRTPRCTPPRAPAARAVNTRSPRDERDLRKTRQRRRCQLSVFVAAARDWFVHQALNRLVLHEAATRARTWKLLMRVRVAVNLVAFARCSSASRSMTRGG